MQCAVWISDVLTVYVYLDHLDFFKSVRKISKQGVQTYQKRTWCWPNRLFHCKLWRHWQLQHFKAICICLTIWMSTFSSCLWENKFLLDTHKISFVLFMLHSLWMPLRQCTFLKNFFFIICLTTLYLCDPMISCLLP